MYTTTAQIPAKIDIYPALRSNALPNNPGQKERCECSLVEYNGYPEEKAYQHVTASGAKAPSKTPYSSEIFRNPPFQKTAYFRLFVVL